MNTARVCGPGRSAASRVHAQERQRYFWCLAVSIDTTTLARQRSPVQLAWLTSFSVYEERMHSWVVMPEGIEHRR